MYLRKICGEIADLANDDTLRSGGTNYSRCKGWVRQAYYLDILSSLSDWYFLHKSYLLATPSSDTTGTATTTQSSTSVTGSSTSWTSAQNDRMLVLGSFAQRISSVGSTTSLTLESAWENSAVSGAFNIVKDLYELPRWLDPKRIREIKQMGQDPLTGVSTHDIMNQYTVLNSVGEPKYWWPHDRVRNSYSTGTISGTSGTKVLTGSSTSWTSSDIQQYDQIQVGNYAYTVNSVDSDTSITLFEDLEATIASATTYTAIMERFRIRIYPFPKDAKELLISASTAPMPLESDSDIPSIPDTWQHLLVKGGYVKALKHNQEPGYKEEFTEYYDLIKKFRSWNNRDDYRTDTWWKM